MQTSTEVYIFLHSFSSSFLTDLNSSSDEIDSSVSLREAALMFLPSIFFSWSRCDIKHQHCVGQRKHSDNSMETVHCQHNHIFDCHIPQNWTCPAVLDWKDYQDKIIVYFYLVFKMCIVTEILHIEIWKF